MPVSYIIFAERTRFYLAGWALHIGTFSSAMEVGSHRLSHTGPTCVVMHDPNAATHACVHQHASGVEGAHVCMHTCKHFPSALAGPPECVSTQRQYVEHNLPLQVKVYLYICSYIQTYIMYRNINAEGLDVFNISYTF